MTVWREIETATVEGTRFDGARRHFRRRLGHRWGGNDALDGDGRGEVDAAVDESELRLQAISCRGGDQGCGGVTYGRRLAVAFVFPEFLLPNLI